MTADVVKVAVPFAIQLETFEARKWRVLQEMRDDLDDPKYVARLFDAARTRLASGFADYGSTMYGWSMRERLQNELEETADRLVYGTSGRLE